jgi:hypothetical protein
LIVNEKAPVLTDETGPIGSNTILGASLTGYSFYIFPKVKDE